MNPYRSIPCSIPPTKLKRILLWWYDKCCKCGIHNLSLCPIKLKGIYQCNRCKVWGYFRERVDFASKFKVLSTEEIPFDGDLKEEFIKADRLEDFKQLEIVGYVPFISFNTSNTGPR